ncbi:cytoskeleton-associated protein 2 [Spea bombifrons]|uniref:cytoskeleton-associated protein 2 n=1 Tax=Spea bombifrons TaxID=233779 RepID=UPI00234B5479|nr:cytoskeleton-associated protein 2 [Spea bombifrons]
MATVVQPLTASMRLQPQYKEQRRKKVEEYLSKKMSTSKPTQQILKPEVRSPLIQRDNQTHGRRTEIVKPTVQKFVNKENLETRSFADAKNDSEKDTHHSNSAALAKKNESQTLTFSQSFLKTKSLKEKQLKDVKLKVETVKGVPEKPVKPALGIYRGKIIQSKINSFRATSVSTDSKTPAVTAQTTAATKLKTSTITVKQMPKPAPAATEQRKTAAKIGPQIRPSTSVGITNKKDTATANRPASSFMERKSMGKTLSQRPVPDKAPKTVTLGKQPEDLKKGKIQVGLVKPMLRPQQDKSAQPVAAGNKYKRPTESVEERKARLAEWRAAKGKVMKRPPVAVVISTANKVGKEEPDVKSEPDPPKENPETRQFFWAAMAEEDEQEVFTQKVTQIFGDCLKLIDEGIPKDDVLAILEKHIESIPEAKKFSKFWVCLAHLEKREGQLEKVIAICEEAAAAGAQPLDELRSILADALENLKAVSSDSREEVKHEAQHNAEVTKLEDNEVKSEPVDEEGDAVKGKRSRRRKTGKKVTISEETQTIEDEEKPVAELLTPENRDDATVIRFNVRSTPNLQKMKTKIHMNECSSTFTDFKFITPVRRSQRLELKSHNLPDMLKDHDPCVSGIAQLEDLDSCPSAYIFRKNHALDDVTVKNVPK